VNNMKSAYAQFADTRYLDKTKPVFNGFKKKKKTFQLAENDNLARYALLGIARRLYNSAIVICIEPILYRELPVTR